MAVRAVAWVAAAVAMVITVAAVTVMAVMVWANRQRRRRGWLLTLR